MITLGDISWEYLGGMHNEKAALRRYVDRKLGIEKEVITKRTRKGGWGIGQAYYYITGSDREYLTVERLLKALNKRKEKEAVA